MPEIPTPKPNEQQTETPAAFAAALDSGKIALIEEAFQQHAVDLQRRGSSVNAQREQDYFKEVAKLEKKNAGADVHVGSGNYDLYITGVDTGRDTNDANLKLHAQRTLKLMSEYKGAERNKILESTEPMFPFLSDRETLVKIMNQQSKQDQFGIYEGHIAIITVD